MFGKSFAYVIKKKEPKPTDKWHLDEMIIKMNGVNVKPSKDVFLGENIIIRKDQVNYQIEVLDIPNSRVNAKLVDLYRKDNTPTEAFHNSEFLKYSKDYYRKKGSGRPTKKDRRNIEDYTDDEL